jgi:mono/diheme cytochrome c family protein
MAYRNQLLMKLTPDGWITYRPSVQRYKKVILSLVSAACVFTGQSATVAADQTVQELPQAWTQPERELFWNSPQGSRIIPYAWFLKLEQAKTDQLFADPQNLAHYGYLPSAVDALNPDGLPIGFAKEPDAAGPWLGMTCAACHVGTISYQGQSVLVEGVGSMADTQRFDRDLSDALAATAADDAKFTRFAERLGVPAADQAALRQQFNAVTAERVAFTAMNATPFEHGPGRVDALGVIMNALTDTALKLPANGRPPDAPVRLPWVWNAVGYSRAQYNGSISNAGLGPLLRNVGQVLGVYGLVNVSKPGMSYPSSVSLPDLVALEALLRKLAPPAWPAMLPPIDQAKAAQGAAVFAEACASCHQAQPRDADGLIPVPLVPLAEIGTDPLAARNFMTRPAATGILEGRPIAVFGGPAFGPRAGAATIVGHISTAVAARLPPAEVQAGLGAYRAAIKANPGRLDAYKAIPLAGVWAGAPYLHNGSVANLQQLLTPPAQRAVRFSVGGRDYDPAVVGFPATVSGTGYVLDTTLPGNAATGHDYGTQLPDAAKASLLEYLKTL